MSIYISHDKTLFSSIIDLDLLVREEIFFWVVVYKSESGKVGFDNNEESLLLIQAMTRNSYIWSIESCKAQLLTAHKDTYLQIRKNNYPQGIIFHSPDDILIEQIKEAELCKLEESKNALKLKYGKNAIKIENPLIMSIKTSNSILSPNTTHLVLKNSRAMSLWTVGTFGTHFTFISAASSAINIVLDACRECGVEVLEVAHESELPVW